MDKEKNIIDNLFAYKRCYEGRLISLERDKHLFVPAEFYALRKRYQEKLDQITAELEEKILCLSFCLKN